MSNVNGTLTGVSKSTPCVSPVSLPTMPCRYSDHLYSVLQMKKSRCKGVSYLPEII